MSTSPAQTAVSSRAAEPLRSLLATLERAKIEQARELSQPAPYEPTQGDPLARLRRTMRGEVDDDRSSAGESAQPGVQRAGSDTGARGGAPAEALVGRAVLDVLRTRPLAGTIRAEAVERLASQIDQPDPEQLREILGLLVTGQKG